MDKNKIERKFKRLVIQLETPIAKTGNGPMAGGKVNNLLLLAGATNGDEEASNGGGEKRYLVKGLRGWLNHGMMTLAKEQGVEVCHTSEKIETQKGEKLLPEGFHPNGKCYPEEECIKHRLMGSFQKQSKLRFEPVTIVSASEKKGNLGCEDQKVHIATENRTALMHQTKTAIQDFGERYFSGEISITIEVMEELSKEELGFLLKALLVASDLRLGASGNNGAGKVTIKQILLQEVTKTHTLDKNGKVVVEEQIRNLWKEVQEGFEAWPASS